VPIGRTSTAFPQLHNRLASLTRPSPNVPGGVSSTAARFKAAAARCDRRALQVVLVLTLSWATLAGLSAWPCGAQESRLYATSNVRLRTGASLEARILTVIPRGRLICAAPCESDWCRVVYRGHAGYVATRYLSEERPHYTYGGGGYVNSRGIWVPSPHWTSDGRAPAGATAQCCDGSFSFSYSRRGTCSHHGGVCQWLQ
jgi:hypothetical protein